MVPTLREEGLHLGCCLELVINCNPNFGKMGRTWKNSGRIGRFGNISENPEEFIQLQMDTSWTFDDFTSMSGT
jgi:hypothetical protein